VFSPQEQIVKGLRGELLSKAGRQAKLADTTLEPDLSQTNGAHKDRVVGIADQLAGLRRKKRAVRKPPQKEMSVQQEFHLPGFSIPNASAVSSGS
jgi:hypothetical protein